MALPMYQATKFFFKNPEGRPSGATGDCSQDGTTCEICERGDGAIPAKARRQTTRVL